MKKFLILLLFISQQLCAQDLKMLALENFNNQKWEAASKNYLKYLKKNTGDSVDRYNLAFSKMQLKEFDEAIKFFYKAEKMNFNSSFIYFNLGKIYAQKNDTANMLLSLKEGAKKGLGAYARLQSDEAFSNFQNSKEFLEVLEAVKLNAYACLSAKNYRHFDFG